MPAKQTHESLASALAAAQGEMSNASKNAKNPHFRSTYADLASLRDAVLPVLAAHGIALIQLCDGDGQSVSVTTRLLFGAESMDCGRLTLPIAGARSNPAQAAGAAITYARRYQLGAVAGVAATEDDDGNSLDGTRAAPQKRQQAPTDSKAKTTLRHDVGCKSPGDADAVIRYISDDALGLGDLEAQPDVILGRLERAWERNGHDWSALLPLARGGA